MEMDGLDPTIEGYILEILCLCKGMSMKNSSCIRQFLFPNMGSPSVQTVFAAPKIPYTERPAHSSLASQYIFYDGAC